MIKNKDQWYSEEHILSSLSPHGQISIKVGPQGTPIAALPFPLGATKEGQRAKAKTIIDAVHFLQHKEAVEKELNTCLEYFKVQNENGQNRPRIREIKKLLKGINVDINLKSHKHDTSF